MPKSTKPSVKSRAARLGATIADREPPAKPAPEKPKAAGRGLNDQLLRLGLVRDQDLVLHLPLRYEDHTAIVPLASATVPVPPTAVTELPAPH